MVTATLDKLEGTAASVAERVAEAARFAEHVARDARDVKDRAAGVVEDRVHSAKRAVKRAMHEMEDLKHDAATRVRKAPLAAVGATFAAGLVAGVALGWFAHRPRHS